jgi:hypothetical protein
MNTRRHFIKTLTAVPLGLSLNSARAASDPSRLALVIGNSNYPESPLDNPVNDARAMANLLGQAGFTVSSLLDAKRDAMMSAIEKFTSDVRKSETKLVLFYYAGHGIQLDWRNYLLPLDAVADSAEQVRQSCVDLNQMLGQFGKVQDKTFVFILDACRNNPFGNSYVPEQKGLSQFDAPVGSLLAYATSPGDVATDAEGSGKNSLYTENLVRELSVKDTRIEDALKRVRLNVRLASRGAQIPWETTSLESDVYIFSETRKRLSESEQVKQMEVELATWGRIKNSEQLDDWVAYLHNFPNGRFTEIAQTRLSRLLAARDQSAQSLAVLRPPVANSAPLLAPAISPATPVSSGIDLAAGKPVPQFVQASTNPYSAGRYALGRKFTVGDNATFRLTDMMTGVETPPQSITITSIDTANDRVIANQGEFISDLMGNRLRAPGIDTDIPQQVSPAELQIGKTWSAGWKLSTRYGTSTVKMDFRIVAFEKVRVPAGEFEAFRIEGTGWAVGNGYSNRREQRLWIVPGLNFAIKTEIWVRDSRAIYASDRVELLSLHQNSIDTKCAVASGSLKRALVLRNSCT